MIAKTLGSILETKRSLQAFCAFWIMVALLALFQDFIDTRWRGSFFDIYESAAYKLFWLLFIPFALLFYTSFNLIGGGSREKYPFLVRSTNTVLLPLAFSLTHLFVFALCLSIISQWMHEIPWKLSWLIKEKLSSRLYIVVSVYTIFTYFAFYRSRHKKQDGEKKEYLPYLPVKNGSKSVVVDTNTIKWIKSDAAYLEIHTLDKRHIVTSTLNKMTTELDPDQFRRIHKSTIVNLKMIAEFRSRFNGDYDVILKDGTELRLSRNYAKPLKGIVL